MKVDIIIIAATKDKDLHDITQRAIDSLHVSQLKPAVEFNCILIETFDRESVYENCTKHNFIQQKNFNFHRTFNFALQHSTADYVGFFNNDVIFHANWFSKLYPYFAKGYGSLSPACPAAHNEYNDKKKIIAGYKVREEIAGWAIVVTRETINKIQHFSEVVSFWRSETVYAKQLQDHGIKHGLVLNSKVLHLESYTLKTESKEIYKKLTTKQSDYANNVKTFRKFAIIMPCYLGDYPNAATNREQKFIRAVKSIINQTYKDFELIIVSDGCDKTTELYQKYFSRHENIKCYQIPKQVYMSGSVRAYGINEAFSEYIIYLDSDDYWQKDHLQKINENIGDNDWIYYNDLLQYPETLYTKDVKLQIGSAGTSSICHKRLIDATWYNKDGYAHDFEFIKELMNATKKYEKMKVDSGYVICHTVNSKIDT